MYRNTEARSRNHRYSGKAIGFKYCECVSIALIIHNAMRMRHIVQSSVTRPALQYFSTLSHKSYDFRKRK